MYMCIYIYIHIYIYIYIYAYTYIHTYNTHMEPRNQPHPSGSPLAESELGDEFDKALVLMLQSVYSIMMWYIML